MRFIHFIWLIGSFGLFTATQCTNPSGASPRMEQLATAFCECSSKVAELNEKALILSDTSAAFTALLSDLQKEYDAAAACLQPVLADNNGLKPAEIPEIKALLQKKCPTLAHNEDLICELLCK